MKPDKMSKNTLPHTEANHPLTSDLSAWAQQDLDHALKVLQQVELHAWGLLKNQLGVVERIEVFLKALEDTAGRLVLIGCGSSGRLAVTLADLCGKIRPMLEVDAVMAGGDVALIHAVESFEDSSEFGHRQIDLLTPHTGDLVIGLSASGGAKFVHGALNRAMKYGAKAILLSCSPSPGAWDNVVLDSGPMALSGSTRMQATSVMQIALSLVLFHPPATWSLVLSDLISLFTDLSCQNLRAGIEYESSCHHKRCGVQYQVDRDLALVALTDLVERTPTFGVPLLADKQQLQRGCGLSLCVKGLGDDNDWPEYILGRPAQMLNWPDFPVTAEAYLDRFDFSVEAHNKAGGQLASLDVIDLSHEASSLIWHFDHQKVVYSLPPQLWARSLWIKVLLNMHSTLVYGRLGRFSGQLMTQVKPSNQKLKHRAKRIKHLRLRDGG